MNLYQHEVQSFQMQAMVDIGDLIQQDIDSSKIMEGICIVQSLKNGSGITVSDSLHYEVCTDMIYGYAKAFPIIDVFYRHIKGNSHAYMKSSSVGISQTYIIHEGKLMLGDNQSVFYCDFDGPGKGQVIVKLVED